MLALTELTGWNVAYIRIGIEAFALLAGWLLGGPVLFGTFLFCVTIGSCRLGAAAMPKGREPTDWTGRRHSDARVKPLGGI
ncbi:hypothetical protein [Geobacillus sp. TFV-3]|uniref:hypothetical protein n=1 Tax=Geobacillus sp. TFV-3 TaxID=1897059 RepID=UPI00191741C6|nr:hypothetical protein [Geobacillus sp. TFV-3]KAF0994354.1 hypothetical protein BJQ97_00996 [Geobacillus sp. TFV-3]